MAKEMLKKYIYFLQKHQIYDEKCIRYLQKQSVKVDYQNALNIPLIGCALDIDKKGKLRSFIPCVPYLYNDTMVAIYIYVYVQTLVLIPKLEKKYEENFLDQLLPLFYLKLYLVENANEALWTYDQTIRNILLEDETMQSKTLLQSLDRLIGNYYQENSEAKKMGRKAKRLAKNYLFSKK